MDLDAMKRQRRGMSGADFAKYCLENPEAVPESSRTLGCKPLAFEPERAFGRMEYNPGPNSLNPLGGVQGGFIAAMLDDTMAFGALSGIGGGYVVPTLELKVNYLRPVRPGRLIAEGWLVHRGKTVAFLEGRLLDEDGHECARATATALIREFR
jgi:uncharacterized protein (TIGR00369 family)